MNRLTDHITLMTGASSPYIDSAVILLSGSSYEDAVAGCEALSEELWSPEVSSASIQTSLDYLVYEGKATKDSQFWVAPVGNGTRAISASGQVSTVPGTLTLPVLCTQSAPLATAAETDNNSSEWQVSVHSNNEDLIGLVQTRKNLCTSRPKSNFRSVFGTEHLFGSTGFVMRLSQNDSHILNCTRDPTPLFLLRALVVSVLRAQTQDRKIACF